MTIINLICAGDIAEAYKWLTWCGFAFVFGYPRVLLLYSVTLGIPKTTTQNVLHKRLRLQAYKIQLKQEIKPDDRPCSTPLMKTKPSYGAFVFRTRQHFMWMGVLIDTTAASGEHSSQMWLMSMFEVHQKWTSGVGFCTIVFLVPSSLVRAPLLGLSISIYLNSTCFHRLKPSNKKL